MKKIIVAGAGHGGLVAAYHLAKSGYDVTVYEALKRKDMGHDWHDWMEYSAFDDADLPRPDEDMIYTPEDQCFRNPKGNIRLNFPHPDISIMMDRKELINYLISLAEEAGAKLEFETMIEGPITEGKAVKGLYLRKKGKLSEVTGDLVIDAAGMYSPVRSKLPATFGIDNEIDKRNIFHAYRAYFENTTGEYDTPKYQINLFHMYRPGIDWIITKEDYIDILIGKFSQAGELTQKEIDDAIAAFKKDYPYLGDKIVRGGRLENIPISRMLPMIVADGYAAIGNSAGMTVPLNGSGIVLSMKAGKILADTVKGANAFKREFLWKYEYEYFTRLGKDLVMIDIIKNLFTYVKGDVVDYLLEKGILTPDLIAIADGAPLNLTPDYVIHLIKVSPPLVKLIPAVAKSVKTLPLVPSICAKIPETYDEAKVNKWIKMYRSL